MDQPLPSHDDLDDFVDTLARRIASFDKPALAEAKRLVNRRTLPRAEDLVETQATFLTAFSWPTLRSAGQGCGDGPSKSDPSSNSASGTT